MKVPHEVRPEDLVHYADGDLAGGKRELVEAHLRLCPVCRRWMADFEDTGRLLREASPPIDDPVGRAQLMARIAVEAGRRSQPRLPRIALTLAVLLALLIVGTMTTTPAQARVSIERFFQFVRPSGGALLSELPTPPPAPAMQPGLVGPASLPFSPRESPTLPLGLTLVDRQVVPASRLELRYRNARGLVVVLTQQRIQDVTYTLTYNKGGVIVIEGVEVFVQTDPRPDSVAALTWEEQAVISSLIVLDNPSGGLPLADARQIVEALLQPR